MKKNRVVIIGGASITWMPIFFNDLSRTISMNDGTIVLFDIDTEKLDIIRKFGIKLFAEKKANINLITESNLDKALEGADFVINTVLVGGHDVWTKEMHIIHKYGIEHPKGMSVGPGGLGMSIRQAPFVLELAKKMERICPSAWLLNYSNPMQTISMTVLKNSTIKYLGLCHGVTGTIERFAGKLGIDESDLFYRIGGVNHFEVITELRKGDQDLLPLIADTMEKIQNDKGKSGEIITVENYRIFGAMQCNEDIHGIEFWPHYIRKGSNLEDFELKHNYIEDRINYRNTRWEKVQDYLDGTLKLNDIIDDHTTEKLEIIIDGVTNNTPTYVYANILNGVSIPNIEADICVEIPIVLFRDGIIPCVVGNIPDGFAQITNIHGAVQRFIVEFVLTGNKNAALRALSLDPMCYSLNLKERESLIDELVENSKAFIKNLEE